MSNVNYNHAKKQEKSYGNAKNMKLQLHFSNIFGILFVPQTSSRLNYLQVGIFFMAVSLPGANLFNQVYGPVLV